MIYELFISPLTETYFQKALIGGSIVAVVAGVVGCLVVLRRVLLSRTTTRLTFRYTCELRTNCI